MNYRRITRASGEVVWRCANRVERRSCAQSPSIAEKDIIQLVCNELGMDTFDLEHVRDLLDQILPTPRYQRRSESGPRSIHAPWSPV